jgi:hypothetical protein
MLKGFKIVLNGGSDVMESATIPIQWFFSEEAAAKLPTHILVVDYDNQEFSSYNRQNCGRRYVVPVTDMIMHLCLTRPGTHHLVFIAFSLANLGEEIQRPRIEQLLHHDFLDNYHFSLSFNDSGVRINDKTVASETVKIVVPTELFAKRSESGIMKALDTFVNGSLHGGPIDECHNRHRWLTILPLKLAFYVPFRIIVGAVKSVCLLVLAGLVLFCGYRPVGPVRLLRHIWNFNRSFFGVVYREEESFRTPYGHRVWRENDDGTVVKMPVAPWQVVLPATIGFGTRWSYPWLVSHPMEVWLLATAVAAITGAVLLSRFIKNRREYFSGLFATAKRIIRDTKEIGGVEKAGRRAEETEQYIAWLNTELAADKAPQRVDPWHLPKPFKGSRVLQFRIAFDALKAWVCKPYAR